MSDRCRILLQREVPPPPPPPDYFVVDAATATYKTVDGRGHASVDDFKSLGPADYITVLNDPGQFSGFTPYQNVDFEGNYMNGYPVFNLEWDDLRKDIHNLGYSATANGQFWLYGVRPSDEGRFQMNPGASYPWMDTRLGGEFANYTTAYGTITKGFNGRRLWWAIPRPNNSNKPWCYYSDDGGRTWNDGEIMTYSSGNYGLAGMNHAIFDPAGNFLSGRGSGTQNYAVGQVEDATSTGGASLYRYYRPFAVPNLNGGGFIKKWYSTGNAHAEFAYGGPDPFGGVSSFASVGAKGSHVIYKSTYKHEQCNIMTDRDGRTFLIKAYLNETGIEFQECGLWSGDGVTPNFIPANFNISGTQAGRAFVDYNISMPFLTQDNKFIFVAVGGYGSQKGICYGHPDTGWTLEMTSDVNEAPFAGLLSPGASRNYAIQRVRVFTIPE